jgi:hypothetical protein
MGLAQDFSIGAISLLTFTLSVFSLIPLSFMFSIDIFLAVIVVGTQYGKISGIKQLTQWATIGSGIFILAFISRNLVGLSEFSWSLVLGALMFTLSFILLTAKESTSGFIISRIISLVYSNTEVHTSNPAKFRAWLFSVAAGLSYNELLGYYHHPKSVYDITIRFTRRHNTGIVKLNSTEFLSTEDTVSGDGLCFSCRTLSSKQFDLHGVAHGNNTYNEEITELSLCEECYEDAVEEIIEKTEINKEDILATRI